MNRRERILLRMGAGGLCLLLAMTFLAWPHRAEAAVAASGPAVTSGSAVSGPQAVTGTGISIATGSGIAATLMTSSNEVAAAAAHTHTAACYDGTIHTHTGSSTSGGGCYGTANYSTYQCDGCEVITYYTWENPENGFSGSYAPSLGGLLPPGGVITGSYDVETGNCYGHSYISSYSVNCGYTAGAYYKGTTQVSATCSTVVTKVALTKPTQTLNYKVAGDYSATLTFLDGTTKTVTGTCSYDPNSPTGFGTANSYTVTFSAYNRMNTASTVKTPTATVTITTLGLRGVTATNKYQIVYPGENIDTAFNASMAGGTTASYASGVAVSNYNSSTQGEQTVTISYTLDETHQDTIYVYVIPMPKAIAVSPASQNGYHDVVPVWETTVTFNDGSTLADSVTGSKTESSKSMSHTFADGTCKTYNISIEYTLTDTAGNSTSGSGDRYSDHDVEIQFQLTGQTPMVSGSSNWRAYQRMESLIAEAPLQILYRGQAPDTRFRISWDDGSTTAYSTAAVHTYTGEVGTEEVPLQYTLAAMGDSISGSTRVLTLPNATGLTIAGETEITKGTVPEWQATIIYEDGSTRVVKGSAASITDSQTVTLDTLQTTFSNTLIHSYTNTVTGETGTDYNTGGVYDVRFVWEQDGSEEAVVTDTFRLTVRDSCEEGLGHADYAADSCPVCDRIEDLAEQMGGKKSETLDVIDASSDADLQTAVDAWTANDLVLQNELIERFREELQDEMEELKAIRDYLNTIVEQFADLTDRYQEYLDHIGAAADEEEAEERCQEAEQWLEQVLEEYQEKVARITEITEMVSVYRDRSEEIRNTQPVISVSENQSVVYNRNLPDLEISMESPLEYDRDYAISYGIRYTARYETPEALEAAKSAVLNGQSVADSMSEYEKMITLQDAGFLTDSPEYLRAGVYQAYVYTTDPDYQNVAKSCVITVTEREVTAVTDVRDKEFDAMTTAELVYGTLEGVLPGDQVGYEFVGSADFASAFAGTDIPVVLDGAFVLTGADAGNYCYAGTTVLSADITARKTAVYTVTIPKYIVMDGSTAVSTMNYTITITGDIPEQDSIHVTPEEQFSFRQTGKADRTAVVTQEQTSFVLGDGTVTEESLAAGISVPGQITAELSAGKWEGNLSFHIGYESGVRTGLYSENSLITSWEDMLTEGILVFQDGVLDAGENAEETLTLQGDRLILPEGVTAIGEQAQTILAGVDQIGMVTGHPWESLGN